METKAKWKKDKSGYELENKFYKVIVRKGRGKYWAKLYERLVNGDIFYKFCFPPQSSVGVLKKIVEESVYFAERKVVEEKPQLISRYTSRREPVNAWWLD